MKATDESNRRRQDKNRTQYNTSVLGTCKRQCTWEDKTGQKVRGESYFITERRESGVSIKGKMLNVIF